MKFTSFCSNLNYFKVTHLLCFFTQFPYIAFISKATSVSDATRKAICKRREKNGWIFAKKPRQQCGPIVRFAIRRHRAAYNRKLRLIWENISTACASAPSATWISRPSVSTWIHSPLCASPAKNIMLCSRRRARPEAYVQQQAAHGSWIANASGRRSSCRLFVDGMKKNDSQGFWLRQRKTTAPLDPNREGCSTRVVEGAQPPFNRCQYIVAVEISLCCSGCGSGVEKEPRWGRRCCAPHVRCSAAIMPPDKDIIVLRHHFAYHTRGMRWCAEFNG